LLGCTVAFKQNGDMLNGGVIGFGNMGRQLTRYINENRRLEARIVAASNRSQPGLDIASSEFGLWVTRDVEDLLARGLDFVVVASTSYAHPAQVVKAAEAGCHIFCEKPIALSLAEADRMIEAAEKADVVTVVNYIMRYNPGYLKIKELVELGELGELLEVSHAKTRGYGLYAAGARHRAVIEPEESGGWTVHHACHDVDFLYWLAGPIRSAYALFQSTAGRKDSEEIVLALVEFASGAIGSVADSVCGIRNHYTRIIGSQASLVMTGENEQTVCRLQREGKAEPELLAVRDQKRPGGGLDHFFDCIREGKKNPNSLASARHSLAAALAMRESARTRKPVPVA
jgi:predicted dehydrogenase